MTHVELFDFVSTVQQLTPQLPVVTLEKMLAFNTLVDSECLRGRLGRMGGPWEFNLRDVFRWAEWVVLGI